MVCTFRPPGVSRAEANNFRADMRKRGDGLAMPASRIAASSLSSSSDTQWPSVVNTRSAMFAAAALVKVMQRIFSGGTHRQHQRSIRLVRVLEPADQRLELRPRIISRIIGQLRRVAWLDLQFEHLVLARRI